MRRRALGPLAALSLVVWACGDGDQVGPPPPPPPPPAEPGPVDFDVTTSADVDDGALLLTVFGGPVDSVRGLAGYDVLDAPIATGARAIVYGAIVDGALLRVWVPNASLAARYSVRVDEGARRATYEVVPGASYTVSRRP
ncbi:MAG TPA: hypothetical protein VFM14_02015 [Gemmatimonadales bacterium]|nr:hypothetical protein [Gemmatimonadales bacterium]